MGRVSRLCLETQAMSNPKTRLRPGFLGIEMNAVEPQIIRNMQGNQGHT